MRRLPVLACAFWQLLHNVLQLTDSFCFSQKFWLGAVSSLVLKKF